MFEIPEEIRIYWKILERIENGTDMECVITSGILLDQRLAEILTLKNLNMSVKEYVENKGNFSELIQEGTYKKYIDHKGSKKFGTKIKETYKDEKLIGKNTNDAFYKIKDIRNQFAHKIFSSNGKYLDFLDEKISHLCEDMLNLVPFHAPGKTISKNLSSREKFINTVLVLYHLLYSEMCTLQKIEKQEPRYLK